MTDKEERLTSPRGVGKDVLASLILVSGALCLEWIKSLFTEGVPTLIVIILNLSEITLMLGFVVALIRATVNVYLEFSSLVSIVRKGGAFRAIVAFYQTIDRTRPTTFEIIRECVSVGVVSAFAAGILGILIVSYSSLSAVWLALLTAIGVGIVLFAFWRGGIFGIAVTDTTIGLIIFFAILLLFASAAASIILIFRLLEQDDLLQSIVNYLFLRR